MHRMRKRYSHALAGKQRNVRRLREGEVRGVVKNAAEAAKAALKGKHVLQLHSEQLRPLLALSSAVQLMAIEREEERKREGGEYEGGGDEGD
jgi:hypothetical protein